MGPGLWVRQLEEVKIKHEEHFRKVLQARELVEQMEEKKKQIEQKLALNDKKREMAEQEWLAEKAKRKAAAMKMEEVEAHWKKEKEPHRLRSLQQVFPALFGGWT
ncbi:inner centromere protein isoform X1 [Sigmodon hispidus]